MGGAYEFGRTASANLRERNDSYNEAIGGFLSGSMLGLFRMTPGPTSYLRRTRTNTLQVGHYRSLSATERWLAS